MHGMVNASRMNHGCAINEAVVSRTSVSFVVEVRGCGMHRVAEYRERKNSLTVKTEMLQWIPLPCYTQSPCDPR